MKTFLFWLIAGMGECSGNSGQAQDWQRATAPRLWQFPRDHGAHPDYKTEWWYFTGNLADAKKQPFGYQLVIFRQGLTPTLDPRASQWARRDFYFSHFALSDIAHGRFLFSEAMDRGALGQAGSAPDQMQAWLRDWRIETVGPERYRLRARSKDQEIDVTVEPAKPLVLQGDRGLSQKAPGAGNASHYYSYTRLRTTGNITVAGQAHAVQGFSWFDKEFSTSSLGPEQVGWDWFSLQLDSNEELMLYVLRKKDGSFDVTSSGTWVLPYGQKISLTRNDFQLEPLDTWKSPHTGAPYPARWRLKIPQLALDLEIKPRMADQELNLQELTTLSYYEGACQAVGTKAGKSMTGLGYVELTGYAGSLQKF